MVLQHIARYAQDERTGSLPPEVVHAAKRALVDWFAALVPGGRVPRATLLFEALADEPGRGRALLYPGLERVPVRTAALINATASHTLEFDDIFRDATYHPGCPTIAAALAAAQSRPVSGKLLLRAMVVGYEVGTRIGVAVNPAHYRFWHTTGTVGTFGAVAAVGTVLGLDEEAMVDSLATAATLASGLQQAFRPMP